MRYTQLLLAAPLVAVLACASSHLQDLAQQNATDTSTPAGRDYEMAATQALWGDASFMSACAPPGTPIRDPLTIYLRIKADGSLQQIVVTPESPTGICITKAVSNRTLPRPPSGPFVAKIDLSFTE